MTYIIILITIILYIWWSIYSIRDIKNYFKYGDEFTLNSFSWTTIHFTILVVFFIKLIE